MRFRRKQRRITERRSEATQQARKKIWEDPTIIENLFNDADWQQYQEVADDGVPSQKMAQQIEDAIDQEEIKIRQKEIRMRRSGRIMQVGVAAVLLLFISFQVWHYFQPTDQPEQQFYTQQEQTVETEPQWVSVVNNSDRVDTIQLPDQSTVHLFAQSSLHYPKDFSTDARDIELKGKAYFSVTKDPQRPFSVYAGGTKTTALGTSFTIDTGVDDKHTAVELHSGKVVVESTAETPAFENVFLDRKGANLLFDPQMRIIRHEEGAKEKVKKATQLAAAPLPPDSKQLYMENIPLADVFTVLQQTYQKPIYIQDERIKKIQYTGVIDSERETLEDVLTVISLINDLRYEKGEDGSYRIYRQAEIKGNGANTAASDTVESVEPIEEK